MIIIIIVIKLLYNLSKKTVTFELYLNKIIARYFNSPLNCISSPIMYTLLKQNNKLRARLIDVCIQISFILIILGLHAQELFATLPIIIIVGQIIHYALIAIGDFYVDSYPNSKNKYYIYFGFLLFIAAAFYFDIFANPYMRLHAFIVLAGNLLGGKVDTRLWKILFVMYLVTIVGYEIANPFLFILGPQAIMYGVLAILVIGLCERLSEHFSQAWLIHSCIFFIWAIAQGLFYQEGLLFMLGGTIYAATKFATEASIALPKLAAAANQLKIQPSQKRVKRYV